MSVSALAGVTAASGGTAHSLALKTDGTVWAFGLRTNGRLGDGGASTGNQTTAVQVTGLSGVTQIAAGGAHSRWCGMGRSYGPLPPAGPQSSAVNIAARRKPTVHTPQVEVGGHRKMAEITATELRAWAMSREPDLAGVRDDAPVYMRIAEATSRVTSEVRTGGDDRDVVLDIDASGRVCGIELA